MRRYTADRLLDSDFFKSHTLLRSLPPDVLRLGLTPLYLGFADIWHAVDRLATIMGEGRWQRDAYKVAARVT